MPAQRKKDYVMTGRPWAFQLDDWRFAARKYVTLRPLIATVVSVVERWISQRIKTTQLFYKARPSLSSVKRQRV